jgi:hypothetical protein
MREDTVQIARGYTEWLVKTGGFAKDMTLRDHYAALAMQTLTLDWSEERIVECYEMADAMLKERNK